ncbi:uncharacterized protein H6S33_000940 [Morchella sextelata]|uniref:uncharacterized protein n=1 Tax=Morchella sextelata TaxID=1174677 RepID=UPI001D049761|nr:uncharacterized protein H6S33_000940 [Morchella sextelata]KAH0615304.1 hypothetical protein H6S33_000940 [Morchella sextelata]
MYLPTCSINYMFLQLFSFHDTAVSREKECSLYVFQLLCNYNQAFSRTVTRCDRSLTTCDSKGQCYLRACGNGLGYHQERILFSNHVSLSSWERKEQIPRGLSTGCKIYLFSRY